MRRTGERMPPHTGGDKQNVSAVAFSQYGMSRCEWRICFSERCCKCIYRLCIYLTLDFALDTLGALPRAARGYGPRRACE